MSISSGSLRSQWLPWLVFVIPPKLQIPADSGTHSAKSNCCRDRLRLLSAAAEHIAASFTVLHVCATDGLMLTAAADVGLHKTLQRSVCERVPEY